MLPVSSVGDVFTEGVLASGFKRGQDLRSREEAVYVWKILGRGNNKKMV